MDEPSNWPELQRLTREYTYQLGGRQVPRLVLGPGHRCAYSMAEHRITMGREVVEKASTETCHAILAHEVGHSVEPELRFWYVLSRIWPFSLLFSLVMPFFSFGLALSTPVTVTLIMLPFMIITYLWAYLGTNGPRRTLRLELSADRRAAKLVGIQTSMNALIEHNKLVGHGPMGRIGRLRLKALATAGGFEQPASEPVAT